MTRKFDVIVVGAGILGLAHAFHAAKRNLRVLVIERGDVCRGASVRNFGMVATIAQTSGPCLERSMRTRDLWLEIARESGIRIDNCGCLFVATTDEELNVLTSFAELEHSKERGITLVNSSNLAEYSPPIKLQNLAGGMWV
ncbi:MAG: FAD-dependent oxidoreductase, partial [Methyloligellaceae bacterium]